MAAAILLSLLFGGMIGILVARWVVPGRATQQRASEKPSEDHHEPGDVLPEHDAAQNGSPDVDSVLMTAADELDLGLVVSAADGTVIYRNRAASVMNGTHVGLIVEEHLERALDAARNGERTDDLVELHGPPRVALQLVAEPMPNGLAVATVEDVSERSRINLMRTDFVANISHELKTPVGAIAVLAEALFGENDREVIDRVAGRMVDESHRAVRAIDDLLELSRIESGPLLEDVVALDEVVATAIARGQVVDETKGVAVAAFDGHEPVRLRADRRQLVAALGNLVENAVKYSEPGGAVQVRVRVDDHAVEVMVADQGIGIPARDLERIFERFYRVDRARSRETGGTGLGLSIVRHVASNHGGEVLVSSQEGEGSTFVLRLPASLIDSSTDDSAPHHSSESDPTSTDPTSTEPTSTEPTREQHQ
ncbi:sensor histidine kinase [Ilumatobacter sp.]|uniref:sensor histidine kinase n=1 Tax=Ilumatobacter sp. TaxID=1967498 RepID=UPI003C5D8A45